jgi:hypothetical protein
MDAEQAGQDSGGQVGGELEQCGGAGLAGPTTRETGKVTACAVCGGPATGWGYDGLDPNEQRDPHTGRAWSADMTHYRPVCTAH